MRLILTMKYQLNPQCSVDVTELRLALLRLKQHLVKPATRFLIRKSTDLKKIKNIDDRIEALISSPMIEVRRRRPLGQSQSFTSAGLFEQPRTPIHVPSLKDPEAAASRRMSTYVLSKFAANNLSMPSLNTKRLTVCPGMLNRRKLSSVHPNTPIRRTSFFGLRSPYAAMDLMQTEAGVKAPVEPMEVDENSLVDVENQLPQQPTKQQQQQQSEEDVLVVKSLEEEEDYSEEPASVSQFRVLLGMEMARLLALKSAWEDVIEEEKDRIPEIALNSIRVVTGKCGLLLTKKFPFFRQLIDMAEACLKLRKESESNSPTSSSSLQQRADVNDLLGYWATIATEIAQIDGAFERLRNWRETSRWAVDLKPQTPARFNPLPQSKLPRGRRVDAVSLTSKSVANITSDTPKQLKRLIASKKKQVSKIRATKVVPSKFAQFRAQIAKQQSGNLETTVDAADKLPKFGLKSEKNASETPLTASLGRKSKSLVYESALNVKLPSLGIKSMPNSPSTRKSTIKSPAIPTNSISDITHFSGIDITKMSNLPSTQLIPKSSPKDVTLNNSVVNPRLSTVAVTKTPRGRPRKSTISETPQTSTTDLVHSVSSAKSFRGRPSKSAVQKTSDTLMSPLVFKKTPRGRTPKPTFRSVAKKALSASSPSSTLITPVVQTNSISCVELLSGLGLKAKLNRLSTQLLIESEQPSLMIPSTTPISKSPRNLAPNKLVFEMVSPVVINKTPRGRPRKSAAQKTPQIPTTNLLLPTSSAKRFRGRPSKSAAQKTPSKLISPMIIEKSPRGCTSPPASRSVAKSASLISSPISALASPAVPTNSTSGAELLSYLGNITVTSDNSSLTPWKVFSEVTPATLPISKSSKGMTLNKSIVGTISPVLINKTPRGRPRKSTVQETPQQSTTDLVYPVSSAKGFRGRSSKSADTSSTEVLPKSSVKETPALTSELAPKFPLLTENPPEVSIKGNSSNLEFDTSPLEQVLERFTSTKKTPRGRPSKAVSILETLHETPSMSSSIFEEKWTVPDIRTLTHNKRHRSKDNAATPIVESSSTSTSSMNISQPGFSFACTPLSALRRLSPPPRPVTGTPRPKLPRSTSTPATTSLSLRQSLLMKKLRNSGITPPPPAKRGRKSVRFPINENALSSTPHGHSGGSGSPRESLPVTPHTSIATDPSKRVSKGWRSDKMPISADSQDNSTSKEIPFQSVQ